MRERVRAIDHLAIAVPDLEEAVRVWEAVLGLKVGKIEEVPSQRVRVAILPVDGGGRIELVAPASEESPVRGFLAKRGPGIHHVCFEVPDAQAAWDRLQAAGVPLLGTGPGPGAEGTVVFFLHPKALGGVLVECKQSKG